VRVLVLVLIRVLLLLMFEPLTLAAFAFPSQRHRRLLSSVKRSSRSSSSSGGGSRVLGVSAGVNNFVGGGQRNVVSFLPHSTTTTISISCIATLMSTVVDVVNTTRLLLLRLPLGLRRWAVLLVRLPLLLLALLPHVLLGVPWWGGRRLRGEDPAVGAVARVGWRKGRKGLPCCLVLPKEEGPCPTTSSFGAVESCELSLYEPNLAHQPLRQVPLRIFHPLQKLPRRQTLLLLLLLGTVRW